MTAATASAAQTFGRPARPDLRRWKRRSRMISVFRRLLPLTIAAVILALAGQVIFNTIAAARGEVKDRSDPIRMINPRFQGREGDGRGFVISAASATRDDKDLRRVTLEKPVITMGVDTAKPTHVTAQSGLYIEGEPVIRLSGDVQVDDASGYHFTTELANLDTVKNLVEANSPLAGTGPIGQVQSDSYGVYEDGDRIIFRGRVRAQINRD
jgi:lipopolysaccharide export system protein LptC